VNGHGQTGAKTGRVIIVGVRFNDEREKPAQHEKVCRETPHGQGDWPSPRCCVILSPVDWKKTSTLPVLKYGCD